MGGIWFDRQEIHHAFFAEIVGVAIVTDRAYPLVEKRCDTGDILVDLYFAPNIGRLYQFSLTYSFLVYSNRFINLSRSNGSV